MPAPTVRREFAKGVIDRAIRTALASTRGTPRRWFAHLLWNVQSRSGLLRPSHHAGRIEAARLDEILRGLRALGDSSKDWLRPVEAWEPEDSAPIALFSSLAHHLLAEYPVPPVLLSAWFRGRGLTARRHQGWFRHVGRGGSLRTAGFPIDLTRRMAHEFAHAPARFPVEFALRWAQVLGLGGPDELARAIASTRLGWDFGHDDFWVSVIHLFLNTPRVAPAEVGAIVDGLHGRKFEPMRAIIGDDIDIDLDPPEPGLSIKGRTVASLLRRVAGWRAEAEARSKGPEKQLIRWDRSGVGEYRRDIEEGRAWTIRELLDSNELAAEGEAMHHCVATYTGPCSRRKSTIWSLGSEGPEGRSRLLTIEVEPGSKRVVQASMRGNEDPDEPCLAILRDWAEREGLGIEAVGRQGG